MRNIYPCRYSIFYASTVQRSQHERDSMWSMRDQYLQIQMSTLPATIVCEPTTPAVHTLYAFLTWIPAAQSPASNPTYNRTNLAVTLPRKPLYLPHRQISLLKNKTNPKKNNLTRKTPTPPFKPTPNSPYSSPATLLSDHNSNASTMPPKTPPSPLPSSSKK